MKKLLLFLLILLLGFGGYILYDTYIANRIVKLDVEEEVNGTHAESTGKISEDKLFYLMSRGMSESDAKKLIIKSNFTNIINEINDNNTKDEVLKLIDELL
jgi:hypothetical protein